MLLYNTTFGIDASVESEFLNWLRTEFIAVSTADGEYFTLPELFYVNAQQEPGIKSIALHLRAQDAGDINRWYEDHGSRLFNTIMQRWNGRVVFFSTTLEMIQ